MDFLDFIRVGGGAIGRDNVPQKGDLGFRELALVALASSYWISRE